MIGCTENSVRNYQYSLCNNPKERFSQEIINLEVPRGLCTVGNGKC